MIADITGDEIPGFDLNEKARVALGIHSIPANLILPPHDSEGKAQDILVTPQVLLPHIVIDHLEKASGG